MSRSNWTVSPYPDAFDFAFTIVHDADDSFSGRLAPLFRVFDEHAMKLTVTAFAFWADWAERGAIQSSWEGQDPLLTPKAVPLEDPREMTFYRGLADNGHEIGLHTASDSHDVRDETQRAFDYYYSEFGKYPPVYVEHRDNLQNHQRSGADPASEYYITDILNQYKPWVWIVSPSAIPYAGQGRYFDVLSEQRPLVGYRIARSWGTLKEFIKTSEWDTKNGRMYETIRRGGTPIDHYARQKFGLAKAFRRSGRHQDAHGDGFLHWHTDKNLDALERHGGLALVYTHLNTRWLDKQTGEIRTDIRERLAAVASRNVWLATASSILDRFNDLDQVYVTRSGPWLKVVNANDRTVPGLTLNSTNGDRLWDGDRQLQPNSNGKTVLGDLGPRTTLTLRIAE